MSHQALPGMEPGTRTETTEYRVIVNPHLRPPHRWTVHVPPGGDPWRTANEFYSPVQIERRTVVTYTTDWATVPGEGVTSPGTRRRPHTRT